VRPTPESLDVAEPSQFKPHITISYSHAAPDTVPARPLIERLASMRAVPPISVDLAAVDLLALRREGRVYRWDILHRILLG
jgi:hypothetical protein